MGRNPVNQAGVKSNGLIRLMKCQSHIKADAQPREIRVESIFVVAVDGFFCQ